MTETWLPITGTDYAVSNHGRVRAPRGNVLTPQPNGRYGYLKVHLGRGRQRYVHRLVAAAFLGNLSARQPDRWGQYVAAIDRWESELGPKGSPRLAARFSEWMMGVPAGWITDVPDLTRNEALKACGNGVVPQQATAAVLHLAARMVATTAVAA